MEAEERKKRRGGFVLFGLILLSLGLVNGLWGQSAGEKQENLKEENNPIIQVIPERFDLGFLRPKKTSRFFLVRNVGTAPLEIYSISTSCGCTKASIDQKVILPGKSATMVVSYDPTIHQPLPSGKTRKESRAIYIRSNDPKSPEKTVYITAMVTGGGRKS